MRRYLLLAPILLSACAGPGGGASSDLQAHPDRTERLRVMAYNIRHGEGTDSVVDLRRAADVILREGPDLVTLQEVDRGVRRTGGVDQAVRLAQLTGMAPAFGAFMDYDGGEYGMAILSRWPIVEAKNERLPDGTEPRTALTVRVRSPETGTELVLVGVHFYRTDDERLAQMRRLADALADERAPVILAGDFNSEPGSPVMRLVGESWTILSKGTDRLTFPSDDPDREIDFIAVRPAERFEILGHHLVHEELASDHRPLVADLVIRPR